MSVDRVQIREREAFETVPPLVDVERGEQAGGVIELHDPVDGPRIQLDEELCSS